jgi:hypothetical protein
MAVEFIIPVNEIIDDDVDDDDDDDDDGESDVVELIIRTSSSFSMITLEGDDRRRITFVSLISLLDIVNN